MDKAGADFEHVIETIRKRLGARPVAIQIPIGAEAKFKGVVDLVEMRAIVWNDETMGAKYSVEEIPADLLKKAEAFRLQLIESVAEYDDDMLHLFLEGETPTAGAAEGFHPQDDARDEGLPGALRNAFKNKGVQTLLDAVVDYLPSPLDIPPVEGIDPDDHRSTLIRKPDDSEPFAALAFKMINDPFGKLSFIRIYSGSLKTGDTVLNPRTGKTERVGRLVKMHANKREDIIGDLCRRHLRLRGLEGNQDGRHAVRSAAPDCAGSDHFPEPVISVAIEPKTKADQEKMGMALAKLADEDPTFKVRTDEDSGQTIISGMGELHLEIIVDRMKREHKVEANVGKPQVAFRETIRKNAEAEGKYIRQTGGSGNYGHCKIRIEPNEPGKGYEFVNDIKGGSIPRSTSSRSTRASGSDAGRNSGRLRDGRLQGVALRRQLSRCRLERNGVQDCRFDGLQGSGAQGKPVLLEPVMAVEVTVPEEHMGTIIGDMNSRRGRIEGMEHSGGSQVIKAIVPLKEMFGYATHMRSSTQGRANYSMQFAQYEEAPRSISEEIIGAAKSKADLG